MILKIQYSTKKQIVTHEIVVQRLTFFAKENASHQDKKRKKTF